MQIRCARAHSLPVACASHLFTFLSDLFPYFQPCLRASQPSMANVKTLKDVILGYSRSGRLGTLDRRIAKVSISFFAGSIFCLSESFITLTYFTESFYRITGGQVEVVSCPV